MITLKRFQRIERAVVAAGYGDIISWSETVVAPTSPEEFAAEAIYVICNSGMRQSVAAHIHQRCMRALHEGRSASTAFGHPGKRQAIDIIWAEREALFSAYLAADDKVTFCESLPWVGPVTKQHLAKNFGIDIAKADRHLERLARAENTTTERLCRRLARQSGYRVATVDSLLWRACAIGILTSSVYEERGWRAAFSETPTIPSGEADDL